MIMSKCLFLKELNQSELINDTCKEFCFIFFDATSRASKLTSEQITFQFGLSFAKVRPIAPEPVPRSKTHLSRESNKHKTSFINVSVSGRGIKTLLST